jgi:hypothetical protein
MLPEISASKVAGLIGLHKYQETTSVLYELLCKNKDIKTRIRSMEAMYSRKPYEYVVAEVLREQSIRDVVDMGLKAAALRPGNTPQLMEEIETNARVALDLRFDQYTPAVRTLLAAEVRGQVAKQRGTRNEAAILNQYEEDRGVKVVERNTKMCRKTYSNFKLVGRTDGFVASENRIVDSKDRTRAFESVPIYDEIQLRCYMDMTGATESELVERFPDGTTRHTKFMNDPEKWKAIENALERAALKYVAAIEDEAVLKEIVFANTVLVM